MLVTLNGRRPSCITRDKPVGFQGPSSIKPGLFTFYIPMHIIEETNGVKGGRVILIMNNNPFSLFLILILLVLSTDKQADVKLGYVRGLLDQTSRSLKAMREGVEAMNASFETAGAIFARPSESAEETQAR